MVRPPPPSVRGDFYRGRLRCDRIARGEGRAPGRPTPSPKTRPMAPPLGSSGSGRSADGRDPRGRATSAAEVKSAGELIGPDSVSTGLKPQGGQPVEIMIREGSLRLLSKQFRYFFEDVPFDVPLNKSKCLLFLQEVYETNDPFCSSFPSASDCRIFPWVPSNLARLPPRRFSKILSLKKRSANTEE